MKEYHKIKTVYLRDPETKFKTLLEGQFALPEFAYLQNNEWVFTEKVDGTNIRIMFDGEKITFGGKSDNAQIPSVLANNLNDMFLPLRDKFAELFADGVCLYGEGYGGKIQKAGATYGADQRFVLFDVKIGEWWLQRKDVDDAAIKLEIDTVPIIGSGSLMYMVEMVKAGVKSAWGDFSAEGIVARPLTELKTRRGDRMITKIKYKDFGSTSKERR